ncbi:MAG TPA: CopG family transcriptional regulator [Thermoanaerobaculia bacterium]
MYREAQEEAHRQGISFAELCRRSIAAALTHATDMPWMRFAGAIESAGPDASRSVDEVVYGRERP